MAKDAAAARKRTAKGKARKPVVGAEPPSHGTAAPVRKVVIVGGGCAGLSAAWELSKWRAAGAPQYEVHVYERSWRLGGKGASGRAADGRILEHGLHVWLGFYENAFGLMRECYAALPQRREVGPVRPLAHECFDEAFVAEPHIGVGGRNAAGDWEVWSSHLPPMPGQPGDPLDLQSNPFTLASYLGRCLHLLKALTLSFVGPAEADAPGRERQATGAASDKRPGRSRPDGRATFDEAVELDFSFDPTRSPSVLVEHMARLLKVGLLTGAAGVLQGVTIFENWLHTLRFGATTSDTVLKFLEALAAQTRKLLRDLVAIDEQLRRKTEIIDIVLTIAVGLYRDRVLFNAEGLDSLNGIDYRKWLTHHGATHSALESRFVTGIYDLVFAYENGDRSNPELAAGVALRGALRMFFTYRGAMFWRMRSGMGDAVFAPLYEALRQRGVHFHFRHTLAGVDFDEDAQGRRRITNLQFSTPKLDSAQTDAVANGKTLDHFGGWPAEDPARPARPAPAKSSTWTLPVGDDAVVLATGIDDLFYALDRGTAGVQLRRQQQWVDMRSAVKTVATRSTQVWLNVDLDALGWHRGPAIIAGLEPPFETWADMTHLLASEDAWRRRKPTTGAGSPPGVTATAQSLAYFCAVSGAAKSRRGPVPKKELDARLYAWAQRVWPRAFEPPDAKGMRKPKFKVLASYEQVNATDSDRYTLSLPGSIRHRISPLDRWFENATVAGDWTACGLDAGCIEAAVMSGRLAAHAISGGQPALDDIIGFHHP